MKFFIILILISLLIIPLFFLKSRSQTVLIMLGPPGSGKGTQAVRLSERFNLPQISTGDLFRDNLRKQTTIGQTAKEYMDRGELVPDQIVLDMLFNRLKAADCRSGYILDGFPRTLVQAHALNARLKKIKPHLIVVSLEVPDEVILERLTGRIVCSQCGTPYHKTTAPPKQSGICDRCSGMLIQRKDDTEAVILDRLTIFHQQSEPLKQYYQQQGNLILIDGADSQEKTTSQLEEKLKKQNITS